jgi:DNA mismatch repair protein MSH6
VDKLETAEEVLKDALMPFICSMFAKFHEDRHLWLQSLSILAELDCLCALATVSGQIENMSRPEFVDVKLDENGEEIITFDLKGMRHPTVAMQAGHHISSFIPNDTILKNEQRVSLVTGPNMGGKSTILRQTAIAAILAQVGCYVPAESFKLSPVDRVFTRIGASDRILEGKSTFYIEMEETKTILQFATNHSLAIMDELGRGTSTHDGFAIATATLNHLSEKIGCRLMFSTHYHMMLDKFRQNPKVGLFHMSHIIN